MDDKSVVAMQELGAAIERLHLARSRRSIKDEQKLFILDGIDDHEDPRRNKTDPSDIKHNFFLGFVKRVHVLEEHVWYVYRNGKFYRELKTGPHWLINWDILFAKWQVRRINLRTVLLPAFAFGRVKGPQLPHDGNQLMSSHLALDVIADFRLLCQITQIKPFLRHESPIKTFYAYFNNMVRELIGDLPYDQYGKWAGTLRANLEKNLQDSEAFIGLKIEKVFVDSIASNEEHDAEVLELYKLVEKGKRELEAALSMQRQGAILEISPSILALQNNEAGRTLLECDAELRKLMIAAGLRPGGMSYIHSNTNVIEQAPGGYLPPLRQQQALAPLVSSSGPLSFVPPPPTTGAQLLMSNTTSPLELRKLLDKEKLTAANFHCRNWARKDTQFDAQGQPLPGGIGWVLDVFVQRTSGYLVVTFQCASDYPQTAPAVRVRSSNGTEAKDLWPNTIVNWKSDCFLVDVVHEIAGSIPS